MAISNPTAIGSNTFSGTVSGTTVTFTTSAPINGGWLVVVVIAVGSSSVPTVSSVSDGVNSYTRAANQKGASGSNLEIWYVTNAAPVASGATVTATMSGAMSGASEGWVIAGWQMSGAMQAPAPVDKTATSTTNATSPSVTTSLLSQPEQICFGATYNNNGARTYTEASGFSNLFSNSGIGRSVGIGYRKVFITNAVTYAPTWDAVAGIEMDTVLATFMAAPVSELLAILKNKVR